LLDFKNDDGRRLATLAAVRTLLKSRYHSISSTRLSQLST